MFSGNLKSKNTFYSGFEPATGADWGVLDLVDSLLKSEGPEGLENHIKARFKARQVLATNLGRTAIFLALKSLGIKEGQKVALPSIICPTVINMFIVAGIRPVILDVEDDLHMTSRQIQNDKTNFSCVLVPHLYGLSAPIDEWENWTNDHGIKLIDDAAQAVGLSRNGRYLGTFGDAGIFSFGPSKNLGAIRGGALIVRDRHMDALARSWFMTREPLKYVLRRICSCLLRYQFSIRIKKPTINRHSKDQNDITANDNSDLRKLPEEAHDHFLLSHVEAGLVCRVLQKMSDILTVRSKAAKELRHTLNGFDHIQNIGDQNAPSRMIPVGIDPRIGAEAAVQYLRNKGIGARRIYRPLHLKNPKWQQFAPYPLPGAESCWRQVFLLPNPALAGSNYMDRVLQHISDLKG